jgi:hypothetical protein
MKIKVLPIIILVLGAIILFVPGCDFFREQIANAKMQRGTELNFETLFFESDNLLHTNYPGQIEVIADNQQEIIGINQWITPEIRSKILSVEFLRYFVLIAMMGDMGSSGYGINVTKVWQNKSTIYTKADFISPEPLSLKATVITSPKHFIKISKEKMPAFGKIAFKLVDKFGREWAAASQDIPPYLK